MDKLCGFNNIGNTCYLNSALQLLINCTVLTKFISSFNFKSEKLNEIKNFLQKYKSSNVISPIDIKNIVAQKDEKFAGFNQNDSHEFLILLLEIIENELKKEYLFRFLQRQDLFLLMDTLSQRTSGQQGLDMDALKDFPISLPEPSIQEQICKSLSAIDSISIGLQHREQSLVNLKRAIADRILSGRKRVRV